MKLFKHLSPIFIIALMLQILVYQQLPKVEAASAPPYTASYYITNPSTNALYNLGCSLGTHDKNTPGMQSNLVLLDFGAQQKNSSGEWGASLWNHFQTNSQIANLVKQFGIGYYDCTGNDTDSQLIIGIGTNNSGSLVNYTAGSVWASLAFTVDKFILDNGYSRQVTIFGANDMEVAWNSILNTRDWVDGYHTYTTNTPSYYNFGSADGCPTSGTYTSNTVCSTSTNSWKVKDIYYISYGAKKALALPEIYTNSMATQWQKISKYGNDYEGGWSIYFEGALSEYGADSSTLSPSSAWTALYNKINSDPATAQAKLYYSTDIRWQ